ncbi:MAG: sulfotransferase [Anaerolineae bacterium]|nr:sulfotransferase [Anaerolineae bacterium]
MRPKYCYIICTTPRSGSSLLCDILRATHLAGQPNEYFFHGTYPQFFKQFEVSTFPDYLQKVLLTTSTPNGVFGAKFMTYYFFDFIERIQRLPAYQTNTHTTSELLARVFPNLKYIWLTRRDKVRQAVSYAKAIQTDVWHVYGNNPGPAQQAIQLREDVVKDLMHGITLQETAWQEYFSQSNITPLTLVYEDFNQSLEPTARLILNYLGVDIPKNWTIEDIKKGTRLANQDSDNFVQSYREMYKDAWFTWQESSRKTSHRWTVKLKKIRAKILTALKL